MGFILSASSLHGAVEPELRGVWMHATQIKTPAETRACVERIAKTGFNAVFVLVWYWGGEAYFKSSYCPMGRGVQPGHDPLGALVAACRRRGIQVHAWFVNGAYGAKEINHVLDRHPDWAVDTGGGGELWYDLGKPEVRAFERDLMLECLRKYAIDGLHFDYIRYGPRYCFCRYCRREFSKRFGLSAGVDSWGRTFPLYLTVGANPVGRPDSARVLLRFRRGLPAAALNRLGKGEALLLNWHAEDLTPPAVSVFVQKVLARWKVSPGRVFLLNTRENRALYGERFRARAFRAFERLGFKPKYASEDRIGKLQPGDLVVLPAVYSLSSRTAAELESFMKKGGYLLFMDGPVRSMQLASVRRMLGMKRSSRYFHGEVAIEPVGKNELVPVSEKPIPISVQKDLERKWASFRAWGVTQLVREVYRGAKKIRPSSSVSAAVFTPLASARRVFQDWPGWLREGIVDFVVPMAYTSSTVALAAQVAEWKTVDPELRRIIPGLSIYLRKNGKTIPRPPSLVLAQRGICKKAGARGNVYFSLHYLSEELISAFRKGPYLRKAPPYIP